MLRVGRSIGTVAAALLLVSCGGCNGRVGSGNTWTGTVTTEGNLTTVINTSGSVWGGTATVIEEMAVGVEAGADELMFGDIAWIHEHGGTIYVVDPQVPAVRMFDRAGAFLGNVGAPGQGPGEYDEPFRLAVGPSGRIFVSERRGRIDVYSADGAPLDTWTVPRMVTLPASIVVDDRGVLWVPVVVYSAGGREYRQGLQAFPDGEPGGQALIEQFDGEPIPPQGSQGVIWTSAAGGALIVGRPEVAGYRFEVQRRGETVLAVEQPWEPVPIDSEYAVWYMAAYGDERPASYPAFIGFTEAVSGEIWVTRSGPVERNPDCEPDLSSADAARATSCWRSTYIVDVFAPDGRYLGDVDLPDDIIPVVQWMHIDGDMLIARSQADDGVLRVKRFRIVLPGEGE